MEKLSQEQLDILKRPLPPEAIKPHPTKTYLSSIKAIYVTERFNEAFGVGVWSNKVEKISENPANGMVVVKCIFEVPKYGIYYECFGGNDNGGSTSKNFDLGDAYKGANTDALTKIGSWLGVGIDVFRGLNDKPQNNSTAKKDYPEDNRPWLSEKQFGKVKERIVGGDKAAFEAAIKAFRMKKEYRKTLEEMYNEL